MEKRKLVVAAILFAAILSAAYAGGREEKSVSIPAGAQLVTADRIGNPDAPITLRYSVGLSYSHQASIPARVEYLTKASTEWAKAHPNVKLILEIQSGSLDQVLQKMMQQISSNTAPDFAMIDGMYVPLFYKHLSPIDAYVNKDEVADYFDWTRDTMIDKQDGKLKSLWFTTGGAGLWYRKDLISTPPKTWDEWIAAGNQLKAQGYKDGMIAWGAMNEQIVYGNVLPMFYGLGGNLVDATGKPIFGVGSDRDKMIEVFNFWLRAVKEGLVSQRIIDIKADGDMAADASKPNQVAMILANNLFISQLKSVIGKDAGNWAFTFIPQKTAEAKGQVAGGWNWGFFTKDPARLKAAVDFVQTVYTSKEGMAGWCYAGGYTPTRKSVLSTPQFATDEYQKSFAKVVEVARTRPGVKSYNVMTVNLQSAWQAVILGKQTPSQAVEDAYKRTMDQISD
ncbi:MAG: extracellular solute-binding protein [Treponemataceae bacterium]